jgi:hypothetical protein
MTAIAQEPAVQYRYRVPDDDEDYSLTDEERASVEDSLLGIYQRRRPDLMWSFHRLSEGDYQARPDLIERVPIDSETNARSTLQLGDAARSTLPALA